jgi:outer membrane protein
MIIKTRTTLAAFVLLFAASFFPSQARAQGIEQVSGAIADSFEYALDLLPQNVTAVRIGVGPAILPGYMGDNRYKIHPAFAVSFRYRDLLEIDNNELKITALSRLVGTANNAGGGKLRFGPLLSVDFGRKARNSRDLTGLGNIGTSIELGAFVGYTYGPVRARIKARHDVASGHSGMLVKGDVSFSIYRGKKLSIGSSLSTTWTSSKYMSANFGINAAQSIASGLAAYAPGSGMRDMSFGVAGSYALSPRFSVIANAGYSRLLNSAKKSPLILQRGSADQFRLSSYLVYAF